MYVARHAKKGLRTFANDVAQDQPVHPRSLTKGYISAFSVRWDYNDSLVDSVSLGSEILLVARRLLDLMLFKHIVLPYK